MITFNIANRNIIYASRGFAGFIRILSGPAYWAVDPIPLRVIFEIFINPQCNYVILPHRFRVYCPADRFLFNRNFWISTLVAQTSVCRSHPEKSGRWPVPGTPPVYRNVALFFFPYVAYPLIV